MAKLLAMHRTTSTAALKPLERQGYVAVGVDPEDRRGRLSTLTDHGRATLAAALPIRRNTHAAVEAGPPMMSAGELRAALAALTP